MNTFSKNTLILAATLAILSVILGAFGAHGLKPHLSEHQIEVYKTGVSYQFYHAFAIGIVGLIAMQVGRGSFQWPIILFTLGIVFFSGSLYLISTKALTGVSVGFLGPLTPIGGLLFIAGWSMLIVQILRTPVSS